MGSDSSPDVLFEAVMMTASTLSKIQTIVVLATPAWVSSLKLLVDSSTSIEFYPVEEAIEMEEEPLWAIRRKRRSSLVLGMELLRKGEVDAFVSAGNTGALIAAAVMALPPLKGIERPALMTNFPSRERPMTIIDVGGKVECEPLHLVQFAKLGIAYQKFCYKSSYLKVGLLNIGAESQKGTAVARQAHKLLSQYAENHKTEIGFLGNVEGHQLFDGNVHVLVTDGFTGNILLKVTEGVSEFIFDCLGKIFMEKLPHLQELELQKLKKDFHFAEYPGAILGGIEGLVIKCHGRSSVMAAANSIKGAFKALEGRLMDAFKLTVNES